jgi:hypothetical protein
LRSLARYEKRVLAVSLTVASVLGFLDVNYKSCGVTYEGIVRDRSYLVRMNQQQFQGAADWIVYALFAWGGVLIFLVIWRSKQNPRH